MITPDELQILLADLESVRIERTEGTKDPNIYSKAICAFANDLPLNRQPGYLILGVTDEGKCSGLDVTDKLLLTLSDLKSSGNIQPLPTMNVQKIQLPDGDVAVVEVYPSDLPPVRYFGQIWIRVGPRQSVASEQDERILMERRVTSSQNYDTQSIIDAELSDISAELFTTYRHEMVTQEIIEENHRTLPEQTASLRLYDLKHDCPTVAGILICGINPRYFLPGAYVQYLVFPGTTMNDIPDDQAEISGDLSTILKELDLRVRVNTRTSMTFDSPLHERVTYNYPSIAIRELILNAIMHRDYQSNTPVRLTWFSDRIEINNPGGLYGEVTLQTIERCSGYRNPVIAEAMKAFGYVNRFGFGIQRAQSQLHLNGNPPAEFETDGRYFLAIVRKKTE